MNKQSNRPLGLIIISGLIGFLVCACIVAGAYFFVVAPSRTTEAPSSTIIEVNGESVISSESQEPSDPDEPAITSSPTALPVESNDTAGSVESPTVPPLPTSPPMTFDLDEVDFAVFYEVWQIVERDFDGDLPGSDQLLQSAIQGSLDTLNDEFTRYIPPAVAARMREDLQGSFEGIGAFVRTNDDGILQIVRPIAGQPAAKAGIQGNDLILAVDGVSIVGYSTDEAIALVRGPRGTAVTLTISREDVDEPFDITVVRDRIEIPIIESEMLPDNIAYVRLTQFNRNAQQQLQTTLQELMDQNPRGVIFDLRDNPGGFLDQSVAVANIFLPEGVVLLERNRRGLDEVFRSTNGGIGETIPLVVLVNAGSASASEIVAGAIQDRGRAVLIGEQTFGKGSVQQTHTLSDGSELRVTIARWYTPDNNSIDGEGITPDIEVLPSPLEFLGPDDTQLQRAIEYLLNGE